MQSAEIFQYAILFTGGFLAGGLGGFLGIGGGVILMPFLRFIIGLSPAYAAGNCITAVFFTAAGGSYRHYKNGNINIGNIRPLIISGAIASIIFSIMFIYLAKTGRWIDISVGAVFLIMSLKMIKEGLTKKENKHSNKTDITGSTPKKIAIGATAGALPGLLGIGTGVILVPAFTYVFKTSIKTAMASSLACFVVNAFISTGFKYAQGFVLAEIAVPLCIGTFTGANAGAILNRKFSANYLKVLFGLFFLFIAIKFISSFYGVKI